MFNRVKDSISKFFSKPEKDRVYKFHKWRKQLIFIDLVIYLIVIILFGIIRPDILMISVYFMLWAYLFLTARQTAFYHLFVSSIIAIIWTLIANNQYGYNQKMLIIFGLNAFPLFSWALGLFTAYLIYSHLELNLKYPSWIKKMILFVAFYWPILILIETIVYHIFNIKNLSTSMYTGLPICDCIHAPVWMQIGYLALGPIYFLICELVGLDNPHLLRKKNN